MDNQIRKPLTIARQEFLENLANVINESELPAFIIGDVLSGVLSEVRALAERQYNNDRENYEKSLTENESK